MESSRWGFLTGCAPILNFRTLAGQAVAQQMARAVAAEEIVMKSNTESNGNINHHKPWTNELDISGWLVWMFLDDFSFLERFEHAWTQNLRFHVMFQEHSGAYTHQQLGHWAMHQPEEIQRNLCLLLNYMVSIFLQVLSRTVAVQEASC